MWFGLCVCCRCGIPRGMNLATFLAKQTIDARTANNNVLRHSHHSSWRRRPSNQSTHTRADVVGRMKSSTSSPSEAINGPSSTADEAVGIGRASGTSDPESGLARNSSSTRGPELLRASSLRRTQSTRTGRRVLAKLATAYENSPEAYENNSIVTAVIDGTLQDMPRAPDLFMRTKSSFPNPTWTQVCAVECELLLASACKTTYFPMLPFDFAHRFHYLFRGITRQPCGNRGFIFTCQLSSDFFSFQECFM